MTKSKSIYYGPPPGVSEGTRFPSHDALHAAGVHRFRGQGISGTPEGVDSIVLSGGYAADVDGGDVIIYTGRGGNPVKRHITADQELTGANAGLAYNAQNGLPVRFVRGLDISSAGKARGGYEYAGIFLVQDYWSVLTKDGHLMWQFLLVKEAGELLSEGVPLEVDEGATEAERKLARYVTVQRRVRNTRAVRAVKALYKNLCQVCRKPVLVGPNLRYSEGAHIHALGAPHHGPDVMGNVLCLCPTCHVLFDNGALFITDDFHVLDGFSRKLISELHVHHQKHRIKAQYLKQHRSRWAERTQGL